MKSLLRTKVGPFEIQDSVKLEEIVRMRDEGLLDQVINPTDSVFRHLPSVTLSEEAFRLVKNGNPISAKLMGSAVKDSEICLYDQVYVRAEDGKQTVAQYLQQVGKANNTDLSVRRFIRFETGEGIEKKVENFAEEVMSQIKH